MLIAGEIDQPREIPTKEDLKSPILWLCQAHALTEAASAPIKTQPPWESLPPFARGVCDCQYCAVALMLVGYSIETCLKAMLIIEHGVEEYIAREKDFYHHKLEKLGSFLPALSLKDKAILRALTHFTMWAGRYPDPGSNRTEQATEIFNLAEKYKITGSDLFDLAARVMKHVQTMTEK